MLSHLLSLLKENYFVMIILSHSSKERKILEKRITEKLISNPSKLNSYEDCVNMNTCCHMIVNKHWNKTSNLRTSNVILPINRNISSQNEKLKHSNHRGYNCFLKSIVSLETSNISVSLRSFHPMTIPVDITIASIIVIIFLASL